MAPLQSSIVPLEGPVSQTPQLERQFAATSPSRFLRELVVNGIEAQATEILVSPWLNARAPTWGIKLFVADNGCGMSARDLPKRMKTYASSGKELGITDKNFGVGSRATCLPWNPFGMVVISWQRPDDDGTLVWLMAERGEYGLRKLQTADGGQSERGEVQDEWLELRRRFAWASGTIVVLLGKDEKDDSWFGPNAYLRASDPIRQALNLRFLATSDAVTITAIDPSTTDMRVMRRHLSGEQKFKDWQSRTVRGLLHELAQGKRQVQDRTSVLVDGSVVIESILWAPDPATRESPYNRPYILVVHEGEIFIAQTHHNSWKAFGLSEIRDRLTLIIRPTEVHPDQTRERLVLRGREGDQLPLHEWGAAFYASMPNAVRAAITEARKSDGDIGRLPQHIADRIKSACRRMMPRWGLGRSLDPEASGERGAGSPSQANRGDGVAGDNPAASRGQSEGAGTRLPSGRGSLGTKQRRTEEGVVMHRWDAGVFTGSLEGMAADYQMIDGQLVLNPAHGVIEDEIRFYQERHAGLDPSRVAETVKSVYGVAMAARVTHAEAWLNRTYTSDEIAEQFLDARALTTAMFGLYGLEQEIEHALRYVEERALPPTPA